MPADSTADAPTLDDVITAGARVLARVGPDRCSVDAVAAELGVPTERVLERVGDRSAMMRQLLTAAVGGAADAIELAVAEARDGEDALQRFIGHYVCWHLSDLSPFRAQTSAAQVYNADHFELTQQLADEMLVPLHQRLYAGVERKLVADWGEDMPQGIHPRRLVFVAYLAASGFLWFKSLLDATQTNALHSDEDVIREMTRALASPSRVMRQLGALNDVATKLQRLRDESELCRAVPRLMCEGLEIGRALLMLVDDANSSGAEGSLRLVGLADACGEDDAAAAELVAEVQRLSLPPPPHYQRCLALDRSVYAHRPHDDPEWPRPEDPAKADLLARLHPDAPFIAAPLRDASGATIGVLAAHCVDGARVLDRRDLARVETFATLVGLALANVRFVATLHAQVEARTRELREAQARLVQTETAASNAQLVAGLVHELNTPLGALVSGAQTLQRARERIAELALDAGREGRAARAFGALDGAADAILDASERVDGIVGRLRAFARLDEATRKRVDLCGLLDDVLGVVAHLMSPNIRVERDYGELDPIECYPSRLNQAFANLLQNAFEAMRDGGGTLRVSAHATEHGALVDVADEGVGIDAATLERIFEPGFSTKGGRIGAGLGLATCRQIVDDHGGALTVESALQQGSRFTVSLRRDLPK